METSAPTTQEPTPAVKPHCEAVTCYDEDLPTDRYVLAWQKSWAEHMGVINRFRVYHKPAEDVLAPCLDSEPCFNVHDAQWVNFEDVLTRPKDFIESLQQSPIRVTLRACRDLLPFISTYLVGPESATFTHAEVLRQNINGDCGDLAPVKWTR